jgi:predicted anti-sigma-YlaC factor YlaD
MSTEITRKPFDCGEIKELLPDYLDSELQGQVCTEIKRHLENCEDCRIFVKTVETTIVLYKESPHHDVPEEVSIDLRNLLRIKVEERKKG